MATEEWIVHAKLSGEFHISDERKLSDAPLVQGLQALTISPEFDDKKEWTGLHKLEARLLLENDAHEPLEANVVYERAKSVVDNVVMLATLGIGRPVRVSGGISAKHRLSDEEPRYRFITCATETSETALPAPVPVQLLAMPMDPKMGRVIRWWARGLASGDDVDQLIALNNSLDLLAGMEEGAPGRVRKCSSCGAEQTIKPGLRERISFLLSEKLGYPQETADEVYESRVDLAHARSSLDEADLRRFRELSTVVASAVRRRISLALGVTLPAVPKSLSIDLPSSLLDLEYLEGGTGADVTAEK